MERRDARILIYSVYDITADTWYMLGAYPTYEEVQDFYLTMCRAPFWKDRLSALYVNGSFDLDTGEIEPSVSQRVMMSGSNVSEISPVSSIDNYSEGAGGEKPPVEQSEKAPRRFSVFRKIFGSIRHN